MSGTDFAFFFSINYVQSHFFIFLFSIHMFKKHIDRFFLLMQYFINLNTLFLLTYEKKKKIIIHENLE